MSELTTQDKAELWDALWSSGRIRMMGSAKLGDPEQQHLGLELWARYPGDVDDSHGREKLLEYVHAMMPTHTVAIDPEDGPYLTEDDPGDDEVIMQTKTLSEAEAALCRQCNLWEDD